ncbi:hypothetical protein, variant [Exophiala oligosperma]|uniref:Uncharacterized protein n=1 Tax=Exophiala oligosperma TaxID=215243 RepID=A0A0D2BRT3_9EURO|nr:hypothetical protein, variant [Exophiala oligosperma]KIW40167.1 hypothetical protein, variant [Exophiala oligosperma]
MPTYLPSSTVTNISRAAGRSVRLFSAASARPRPILRPSSSPHHLSLLPPPQSAFRAAPRQRQGRQFSQTSHQKMSLSAMSKRLEGKTVLVTGASSGIGKSVAQEFARTSPKNLKVIITARRIDTLKTVAAEIAKEVGDGVKVLPVQLDISKPEEVERFVPNLPAEFRDIDVLVNNAGLVRGMDRAPDIKAEDMEVMFATNVTGLINMTQAVMPIFLKKNGGQDGGSGDIINIGSIAGREGYAGGSIYCATKAAVRSFTEALRRELIASRIRVIEIDPGQVETVRDLFPSWTPFAFPPFPSFPILDGTHMVTTCSKKKGKRTITYEYDNKGKGKQS